MADGPRTDERTFFFNQCPKIKDINWQAAVWLRPKMFIFRRQSDSSQHSLQQLNAVPLRNSWGAFGSCSRLRRGMGIAAHTF